jgi:predicted small secreted protein
MIRRIAALFVVAASLALAGCNTVRGVGQDLKSAADTVDEAT